MVVLVIAAMATVLFSGSLPRSKNDQPELQDTDAAPAVPNTIQSISFAPIELKDPTRLPISSSDDEVVVVELGFPFRFDGSAFEKAAISTNGYMTFDLSDLNSHCGEAPTIPAPALPNNYLAWAFADLDPRRGDMHVERFGNAPNRMFVLSLTNVGSARSFANLALHVQVILREQTQCAEIHYGTIGLVPKSLQFTAGVENSAGNGGAALFTQLDEQSLRSGFENTAHRLCFFDKIPVFKSSNSASATASPSPTTSSTSTLGISKSTVPTNILAACTTPTAPSPTNSQHVERSALSSATSPVLQRIPVDPLPLINPTRLALSDKNDATELVSLGFWFPFDGSSFDQVLVSSNGYLTFDLTDVDSHCCTRHSFPDTMLPNGYIAWALGDLLPANSGTIFAETVGQAPHRDFVLSWIDVDSADFDLNLNVQVRLSEGGCVELHYGSMGPRSKEKSWSLFTAGFESLDGTVGFGLFHGAGEIENFANTAVRGCFGDAFH
eukprot:c26262_g1_i1.p1 GENE.c26262_g1_i1~~c26262_g1_i1.p1  ORF type:complete len:539 (-),score=150.61 c26262_g1_i1:146-1633(-)